VRIISGDRCIGTCHRCGHEWEFWRRYIERGYDYTLCESCKAKPTRKVSTSRNEYCMPWKGDIDLDTMQPIDGKGRLVKPGVRTCGNSDCMRITHIIPAERQVFQPSPSH
jgi:hypothetical protein